MLNKESQEQSLETYFAGLMAGAGEALWDEAALEPLHPPAQQRPASPVAQKAEKAAPLQTKGYLPARDAPYIHAQPISVVGLKLAVPKAAVREIRPFPVGGVEYTSASLWRDGIYPDAPTLRVIDTARVVVPRNHPRYEEFVSHTAYRHVLVLNGGQWGLACDGIDEDIIFPGETLCWRDASGQEHPWLAATVRDFGYALMDLGRMVKLLR